MTRTGMVALLLALAGCPAPQVGTVSGPGPGPDDPVEPVAGPTAEPTPGPTTPPVPAKLPAPPADRDGDGFADVDDECPDGIELMNGYQDDDGCPDDPPRMIVGGPGTTGPAIIDPLYFESGSRVPGAATLPLLDHLAQLMRDDPDISLIEIHGHVDGREKGRKLDVARAEAARTYLVAHGVAPERLVVKGNGATQPVDKPRTANARAKNRRVEFHVVYAPP